MPEFKRIPGKFSYTGMDIHHPPDSLPPGRCSLLFNLQPDLEAGALVTRPPITALASVPNASPIHSIARMNDSVPEAVNPFARFVGSGTKLYSGASSPLTEIDSGFSGNPLALVSYRPPQSPESWLYTYDSLKQQRYKTDGVTKQNIGIASPVSEPLAVRSQPLYKVISDTETDNSVSSEWAAINNTGGTGATPVTTTRIPVGTTVLVILYDSGAPGMASIGVSSSGGYGWMTAGAMITIDSEQVFIEQVFVPLSGTTVAAIQYDTGSSGLCTIVPAAALPGLARNQLLCLNGITYVRVLSVTAAPDGTYSFRCDTGAVTVSATQTITSPPNFRTWTASTHADGASISGNAILANLAPTVTGGSMSAVLFSNAYPTAGYVDATQLADRPISGEDYMHVGLLFDNPQYVTEVHVMVDIATTDASSAFTTDFLYFVLRQSDFAQSALAGVLPGTVPTIDAQLSAIEYGVAAELAPTVVAPGSPNPVIFNTGQSAWIDVMFKLCEMTRVGTDPTLGLNNIQSLGILIYTSGGVVNAQVSGWWVGGGYGPDCNFNTAGNQAPAIQWRYRYRNSLTGAHSTVSPETRNGEILRRQAITLTASASGDPQVDTVDWERRGGTNPDWHYVGSQPIASGYAWQDTITEAAAQITDPLEVTSYQPWPVTDVPHNGTALVTGTSIVWASGDQFNVRWLRGTEIVIGGKTYSLYAPPASVTFLQLAQSVAPPSGTYPFQIQEATIEGQPLYAGWLDEANNRVLSVGDPLNPGFLYFSNVDNPDGASDSGYIEVTGPSEPLLNGFYQEGSNYTFTASSVYRVEPTPGAANPYQSYRLSGVEGIAGPWAFDARRRVLFYWGPDGIYAYSFGPSAENLTEADLDPLFPHDGQAGEPGVPGVPVTITGQTIYPPVYAAPAASLRVGYAEGFVYATYLNSQGTYEALVYSLAMKGWRKDTYNPEATLFVLERGVPNPLLMVGGVDGNLYQVSSTTPEGAIADAGGPVDYVCLTPAVDAGDSRAVKQWGDLMFDYMGSPGVQILWDNLLVSGPVLTVLYEPPPVTRARNILDLVFEPPDTDDEPLIHFNLTLLITGTGPVALYEWQPSFLPLPEITTARVTDWGGGGAGLHYKFVQGIRLHFNTFGQPKQVQVQYDGYQTSAALVMTVSANGEQTIPFSFSAPFRGHMMRLVPMDDVPWEVWPDSEWVYEIEPEPANYWISQPTALGQSGYLHCREIWTAYTCGIGGGIVSVIVDGGAPVTLAALPSSGTPVKMYNPCPPFKGRYWQLSATGTNLQLYERDIEFLVKSWGSTAAYMRVKPFGDTSGGGGTSGAKI
jgi:hypothetical protein